MDDQDYIKQLEQCYTGVVHDVMSEMGLENFTFPPELKPLLPQKVICGPVFTIEGKRTNTASGHETLLAWTGLLSKAKSGHIWVSQPHDLTIAHMGELSAETLHKKGVLGCIVDGGIRDSHFMEKLGFQNWRRFHTPRDVVGTWLPTGFDVDIIIGDVLIKPGDIILADLDGIVRIPKADLAEVTLKSHEAMHKENKVRTAIINGMDPQDAYLKYGKF
ncbi:MAG: RraA family protein [Rhizobiales bacterium]|nr:RraA family protein [Hyphomicrobiales bacterium]NRB12770.1 RraA family protein [Hyphomicrobiales bacterium]